MIRSRHHSRRPSGHAPTRPVQNSRNHPQVNALNAQNRKPDRTKDIVAVGGILPDRPAQMKGGERSPAIATNRVARALGEQAGLGFWDLQAEPPQQGMTGGGAQTSCRGALSGAIQSQIVSSKGAAAQLVERCPASHVRDR